MKVTIDVPLPTVEIKCPFCNALVTEAEYGARRSYVCVYGCGRRFFASVVPIVKYRALGKKPHGPGGASDSAGQSEVRNDGGNHG